MKKNAFTLIELIAVIVILSIVLTLSVPSLIGALKNNKEKSLKSINELIILAAKDYVVDYGLEIPRKITQNELCKNYLDCPIINPVTKEEMIFSVIVDENKNYTIDKNELIELKVVLNGGKLSKDISGGYTPNTEIILETPTRERHGFAGWEIVSGDAVIEGSVLKLGTKNSTLVANWTGTPVKLNVDLDGGTSSINYNSEYYTRNTLDLGTPTKANNMFVGWKLVSGDAVLSGNKLTFGYEDVSVKATWLKVVEEFSYTGSEQVYTTPISSYYKIQTWGAQGGNVSSTDFGGYGAYATEIVYLEKGSKLYINVGGAGSVTTAQSSLAGGYNGGGNAFGASNGKKVGSGGGATHIATSSGLLSSFSGKRDSILIVAAGGGGGGRFMQAQQPVISMGGAGGGGTGGWYGAQVGLYQEATAGVENTGGGGGGGAVWKAVNTSTTGASGGSGIVCFRESVELPELAGTWVLNERLYAPKNAFEAKVNYTATFTNTGNSEWKSVTVSNILSFNKNADGTGGYTMYRFNSNEWSNIRAGTVKSITFPVGTTASDEFRAWLASNATKQ